MRTTLKGLLAGIALSLAGAVAASPIVITPADCTAGTCWTADPGEIENDGTGQPSLKAFAELVGLTEADVEFLYKNEQGGGNEGGLPFSDDYSTEYFNDPNDPSDALITWLGDDYINCGLCYLWLKDGNQTPYVYVFDISWWDGQTSLFLDNFWPGNGAISNVGIFGGEGGTQVPEPGTLGLLGIAALGFGLVRRRKI